MTQPLLDVEGLTKHYPVTEGVLRTEVGRVRAVDGVSFTVDRGETLGLVGESGCGKSTAARTTLRLEEPTDGRIVFDGADVTAYDDAALKRFRRRAQMVFQDPDSSFDPRMSIGESVAEPLRVHGMRDRDRRRRIVGDLLERVGLDAADRDRYPHEFSGGQKQRIGLARALSIDPDLMVADEPVSALDVSIQADILDLIDRLQSTFGLAVVVISHDMDVVREVCDRVAVMYLGEIVETAPTEALFEDPRHPYTRALLASTPVPDPRRRGNRTGLTGDVPSPADPPPGCRFHTRCPEVIPDEAYDLDRAAWRAVLNLRLRVAADDVDVDVAREYARETAGNAADAATDPETVRAAIREEFDVPSTLADPRAEAALSDALDRLVADDAEGAAERLAEAFPTVCRRADPGLRPIATELPAAEWAAIKRLRAWVAPLADAPPETVTERLRERCAEGTDRDGDVDELAVRGAFRLPEPLSDAAADRAVRTAVDALLDGRGDDAADALYDAFGPLRESACHLNDRAE